MDIIFKIFILACLGGCTSLIYQPDKYMHANPSTFGIKYEEFITTSLDTTQLVAWKLKSKSDSAENLVLLFHGNAQNMTSHFLNLAWMTNYNSDVIVFDYRGYGLSKGTPSPCGVKEDGIKFLELAHDQFLQGKYKRLIVYTQSLGGAVALASLEEFKDRNNISLLVLDSTFRDPQTVAKLKTNWALSRLISAECTASKNMAAIKMPTLVIHSKQDPVIPYESGEELFKLIPTEKKWMWSLEEVGHGDVFFLQSGKYRQKFLELLR